MELRMSLWLLEHTRAEGVLDLSVLDGRAVACAAVIKASPSTFRVLPPSPLRGVWWVVVVFISFRVSACFFGAV